MGAGSETTGSDIIGLLRRNVNYHLELPQTVWFFVETQPEPWDGGDMFMLGKPQPWGGPTSN